MPTGKAPRTDADRSFDVEVGRNIRTARREAGLTQAMLASKAGVSFQQLQKYETGANRVAASRMARIADGLGVPISALLGEHHAAAPAADINRPDIARLLDRYERCSPKARRVLIDVAAVLART